MTEVVTVTLNNGAKMPVVGFGLAEDNIMIGKVSAPVDHIKASVLSAIQVGYRTFDTASIYLTERALGESLKEAFERGLVSRQEVFVSSKLWGTDCYPQDVIPSLRKSLEALKLEYLDLYLIHWPLALRKGDMHRLLTADDVVAMDIQGFWQAMESCIELGLARAIGVSNFSSKKINDILAFAKIPPAVNQVEMHPVWQQKKLREYCKSVNIHVSAWSPLGGPGNSWGTNNTLDNPVIKEIAAKQSKTPAQLIAYVALRWGLENGVSVITRSFKPVRISQNFQVFDWKLDEEDHEKIGNITQEPTHLVRNMFVNPINGPFKTAEELWDDEI
ncbi:non-functional NADPH-dependent codeinone reductase 2-like [Cryptomeria japonica]|uniref:non-functional NADPH-dependent codeinone reductase 2-like n=1 Tax=Cryptomeria japonica TaxID=3369 RepID=UPI0027DA21B8|nr:non-functional NADPH-dependent codeinone reductase 2-like [Cryptomeria japonica]